MALSQHQLLDHGHVCRTMCLFTPQPTLLQQITLLGKAQIPLGSSRHVSTRLDTFDVSSESIRACRTCRAVLF